MARRKTTQAEIIALAAVAAAGIIIAYILVAFFVFPASSGAEDEAAADTLDSSARTAPAQAEGGAMAYLDGGAP